MSSTDVSLRYEPDRLWLAGYDLIVTAIHVRAISNAVIAAAAISNGDQHRDSIGQAVRPLNVLSENKVGRDILFIHLTDRGCNPRVLEFFLSF